MKRTDVFVTGYPRSGNTWLSRLLGDILNSPVGGMYAAKPLCTEGLQRPGRYFIRQLHLRPRQEETGVAVPNAWTFSIPHLPEVKIVHVVRDPRDVIVSVFYYWQIENVQRALETVCYGRDPIRVHGPWWLHVQRWIDLGVLLVRFEDMTRDPRAAVLRVLDALAIAYREDAVDPAIERQAFGAKREQVQKDGASRPYGRTIQLRHLRKGIVGDYREHLTEQQQRQVWNACGPTMERCGYGLGGTDGL